MRLPALTLALAGLTAAVAGCGGGEELVIRPVAADDPATLTCSGLRTPALETCEGSYFQCRQEVREIVEDMDVEGRPAPDRISRAYVRSYWSEVDRASQAAARRGCRGGLPR